MNCFHILFFVSFRWWRFIMYFGYVRENNKQGNINCIVYENIIRKYESQHCSWFSLMIAIYTVTINAAWVIYYWGLNDTRIVYSYNAKSRHQGNRQSQKQRNGFSYRILIRDLWEILGLLFDMRTEIWLFRLSKERYVHFIYYVLIFLRI